MSTVPTSCIQVESTVIDAPLDKVWPKFRELKLDGVAPGLVSSSEVTGSGVGSIVKIHYADGTVWELLVTELSDRHEMIGYEVLSSTPSLTYTAADGEISIMKVTDTNQSFLKWTTIFSNDADAQILHDQKYKKSEFFAEFKKTFAS